MLDAIYEHLSNLGYGNYLAKNIIATAPAEPKMLEPEQIHLDLDGHLLLVYLSYPKPQQHTIAGDVVECDFHFEMILVDLTDPGSMNKLEELLYDFVHRLGNFERK